ncbi:MAG: class I SAM-dependent methyltransferase [Flavobacteriaceae bacterium]|nr:class I SAM-dependent methyltransferase [Flavobacteriaceae bacterium]
MQKETKTWYRSWFDTPFYHILYKDRDHEEAALFMDNLTQYLNLPKGAKILDLACGKGRHAVYLNQLGFNVTGIDLSENSIAEASKHANQTLHFQVHNMCEPFPDTFDAVFNLFTSFGYFDQPDAHVKTLKAIKADLIETGFGVIDFLNADVVIPNLIPEETKVVNNISFDLKRHHSDGFIIKEIDFEAEGQSYHFEERVKAFRLSDFEAMFAEADIDLLDVFGNYKLQKFRSDESPRLIMIFK